MIRLSPLQRVALVVASALLTLIGLEGAIRIYRATAQRQSSTATAQRAVGRAEYHPRLGWIPRPGRFGTDWISNVDGSRIRSNGDALPPTGRPILAVGDSFTFGDEVGDSETWPAQLQAVLNQRVLNAGVSAYGIDQAVLRAEQLLEIFHPEVVILSFISDDIARTELSYYPYGLGWKPYFEYRGSSLVLRNVPVPADSVPRGPRSFHAVRAALSYSVLADMLLTGFARRWWHNLPNIDQIHDAGDDVSVDLMVRLRDVAEAKGSRLIVVALATNGAIGGNARLANVVEGAKEKGVDVLDLSLHVLNLESGERRRLFRPGGHYSLDMNRRIAGEIAAFLKK